MSAAATVRLENLGDARPAEETADYRAEAETLTIHRGEAYFIRTCYELVEGRWEGFVSMRPAPVNAEVR